MRLLLRALRSRLGASLAVLLAASWAVAAAATGPLWSASAHESLLADAFTDAAPGELEYRVEVLANQLDSFTRVAPPTAVAGVEDAVSLPPGVEEHFSAPRLTMQVGRDVAVRPVPGAPVEDSDPGLVPPRLVPGGLAPMLWREG